MGWFERKTKNLTAGGKHANGKAIGEKSASRTQPVLAVALSIVLVACLTSLMIAPFARAETNVTLLYGYNGTAWVPLKTEADGTLKTDMDLTTHESDIIPATTDTYDIGNATHMWRYGYFGNTLYVDGILGVGTTSPSYLFEVAKGTENAVNLSGILYINDTSGNVGIGYVSPSVKLDVNGTINATNVLINGTSIGEGNLTGSGTTGTLAKWTGSSLLGDSIVSESGSTLTISGNISMPTFFYIGSGATVSGVNTLAIGTSANATGYLATALGENVNATADYATAVGSSAQAINTSATAVGRDANATGQYATALGYLTQATEDGATAVGRGAEATGDYATALGWNAQAVNQSATAMGRNANATNTSATALGVNTDATGIGSTALGQGSEATGPWSVALGSGAKTTATQALAVGHDINASGARAVALGYGTNATGSRAIALGSRANATGDSVIAIGRDSSAIYDHSVALGREAATTAANQFMVGSSSYNLDTYVYGNLNVTSGKDICIEGGACLSSGGGGGAGWSTSGLNVYNDTSGVKVGIGTASPQTKLDIRGSGSENLLNITDGSTDVMYLDSNGRVGIGTTSPARKLHVFDNNPSGGVIAWFEGNNSVYNRIVIDSTISGDSYLSFNEGGSGRWALGYDDDDSEKFKIASSPFVNQSTRLTIHTDGQVGIGTASPGLMLEINTSDYSFQRWRVGGPSDTNHYLELGYDPTPNTFYFGSTSDRNIAFNNTGNVGIGTASPSYLLEVAKGTENAVNLSGILFVNDTSGTVGIGASSPSSILQVRANAAIIKITDADATDYATTRSHIQLGYDGQESVGILGYETTTDEHMSIKAAGSASAIKFGVGSGGNTEAMRVITSGNVGINTTYPNSTLHVQGNVSQNDNYYHCFGDDCDAYMYFNGTSLIIKVT